MSSTFFGLNIGQTGLYAYQSALDTTAHNITNTETEGYTRQVIKMQASKALRVNSTYGMAGTGVTVLGVTQLRDEYYDLKYWKNNTMFGEYDSKAYYMNEIENYFNEVSVDGFTTTYNSMYDSIQELTKNPSSETVRTQVINYADSLTTYFKTVSESLKKTQAECNFEIKNQVDQINSTAQQIAALTKQINTLEVNGGTANDLRDQRALLVDELSQIASVSVKEERVGAAGVGVTSYVVRLDNQTLVDGGNANSLVAVPRKEKVNQNDIDGLYDVTWANGQNLNLGSASLGGSLQALYEVRDGNNNNNLKGMAFAEAGDRYVTLTAANINNVEELNIPETGSITVGNHQYAYKGFEVSKDGADGSFIYTFELEDTVITDADEVSAGIGTSIDYKGIPYYMEQLNEFVRTYARAFNEIHRSGKDLSNKAGGDFFTATDKINGREYTFGPLKDSDDYPYYDFDTFNSRTGEYYEEIPENEPLYGSYYFLTADNFMVSSALTDDPARLAAASDVVNGVENNDIAEQLLALKENKDLFKQGAPGGFFQTMVAEVGIDSKKAAKFSENQQNILKSIENQRLSVSGVDIDEESMNLVKYQNAYNLSAQVITVMDEIYDRLINYMGV